MWFFFFGLGLFSDFFSSCSEMLVSAAVPAATAVVAPKSAADTSGSHTCGLTSASCGSSCASEAIGSEYSRGFSLHPDTKSLR